VVHPRLSACQGLNQRRVPLGVCLPASWRVGPGVGAPHGRVVGFTSAVRYLIVAPYAVHLRRYPNPQQLLAALTLLKLGTPAYNLHHMPSTLHLDLFLKAL